MVVRNRRTPRTLWAGALASVLALAPLSAQMGPKIAPRDTLNITVVGVDELSKKYVVSTDGVVDFPWSNVGRLTAKGLTAKDFETALTQKLATCCVRSPQVSVTLEQLVDKQVMMTGAFAQEIPLQYGGELTLFNAIARNAPRSDAGDLLFIYHRNADGTQNSDPQQVSLSNLRSNVTKYDVKLQDGDTIQLPTAEQVYVIGEVNQPGNISVPPNTKLVQLIALVHGATKLANLNGAEVLHAGAKTWVKIKSLDVVKPGDTIRIPTRHW